MGNKDREVNFKEQFKAIGLDLARKAKNEVKSIKKTTEIRIKELNTEIAQETIKELKENSVKFLRNYEYQLNEQISNNISDLSKKILRKKYDLYDKLILELKNEISSIIKNNFEQYKTYLLNNIEKRLDIFNSEIFIKLNSNDQKWFNEIQDTFPEKTITLDSSPLEDIGGYILYNSEQSVVVNDTIEETINKNDLFIKEIFVKIFPTYVDTRKSATDIMRERNIDRFLEHPKELEDFIEEKKLDVRL